MEKRLEQYMADRTWVAMREIYADLELSREEGQHVWRVVLPGLEQLGLIEKTPSSGPREPNRFRATEHFRAWIAAGERLEPALTQ
jgi:hypothetical protein